MKRVTRKATAAKYVGVIAALLAFPLLSPTFAESPVVSGATPASGGAGSVTNSGIATPDLFSGSLKYSIPIASPPGRKGIQPNLALTYSSSSGNGWLGVGWDLEVGAIERRTKYGVNYDKDDYVLNMSGSKSEILKLADGEFRAKFESGFLRIKKLTALDGLPYFEIIDKTGMKYLFGLTGGTRQDHAEVVGQVVVTRIFKWSLERVEDPNGNFMLFKYAKPTDGSLVPYGQIYLSQIEYAGNSNQSIAPTNVIRFHLETRDDAPDQYRPLFRVKTTHRLKTIEMLSNNNVPVRAYKLVYDIEPDTPGNQYSPSTKRSILTRIEQYGSDYNIADGTITGGTAFPPIALRATESNRFVTREWSTSPFYALDYFRDGHERVIPGDFNGDGKTDIAHSHSAWYSWKMSIANSAGTGFENSEWSTNPYTALDYAVDGHEAVLAGDFNGDGKTDIAHSHSSWYAWRMSITNDTGTGFINTEWSTAPHQALDYYKDGHERVLTGDFNGDGKTDIAHTHSGWQIWKMHIANEAGDGFINTEWSTAPDYALDFAQDGHEVVFAGDFNGDGLTDIAHSHSAWGFWKVSLSTGSGFRTEHWSTSPYYALDLYTDGHERVFTGDFNGDGLTDIAHSHSDWRFWRVSISTGAGFVTTQWSTEPFIALWLLTDGHESVQTGDFNGDGLTDIAHTHSGWTYWETLLSTGNGFIPEVWSTSPYYALDYATDGHEAVLPGDFNGDGKTDLAHSHSAWSAWKVSFDESGKVPDLLASVDNGIGGTTSFTYQPSTKYDNALLPFVAQTLSTVIANDGNGNESVTRYSYSGGFYYIPDRDFRGFNYAKITGPLGPSNERTNSETWFHQGNDTAVGQNNPLVQYGFMKGKPYRTRVTDGSDKVYSESTTSYTTGSLAPPFFNPPDTIIVLNCDGDTMDCTSSTSGLSKKTRFQHDEYGNVTLEEVYASATASTPYRTTVRSYTTSSTDNWMIGFLKQEALYEGSASGGVKVAETINYYDDNSDCATFYRSKNQMPTKGNVTTIVRYHAEKPVVTEDPEVNMSYNGFGNLVCARDPKGYVSRSSYDGTGTFTTSSVNPKGHTAVTQYYGVDGVPADRGLYGQEKSVTDPNGATTTTEYDVLGRVKRVIDPYATSATYGSEMYFYENFGAVGQQKIVTVATTDYATSSYLWKEMYFDGTGRIIKTRDQGPDSKIIVTHKAYDNRGAVKESSLPAFEGTEMQRWLRFKYDSLGRIIETLYPDGTAARACFTGGVTVGVDPDGRRKRTVKDVFGRVIMVNEYDEFVSACSASLGTPYATTTYQYDTQGNLRFVIDAENNRTEMRYDSLGRKVYMDDPDMGVWSYSYDANGNLSAQTDAKGQTVSFAYDELNRATRKDYPGVNVPDVVYTYDRYDDGTTANVIGRLSKMTDASGEATYFYDKLGRTIKSRKKVDNRTYDILNSYDALGRITSITYPQPDAEAVTYSYNAGVLDAISGSGVTYASYAGYNALGQPEAVEYGNGSITGYRYDPLNNRLESITTWNAYQTLMDLSYTYYPGGSVMDIIDGVSSARSQSFQYDGLNRLQLAQSSSYGALWYDYTPTGNIKLKEGVTYDYTGDKPHAVKSTSNGKVYSYDDNGNMISDGTRSLTYDYDNMPQSVTVGAATTTYVYDGSGARVKKMAATGDTIYIGKLYECKGDSCVKYIFANGKRIAMDSANDIYYYHLDHLGSTQVVSNSRGTDIFQCSNQAVRIAGTSPRYFSTIQAAYDAAADGAIIETRAATFLEYLNFNRNIAVTLRGGYDCDYATRLENSQIVGMITDSEGSVTIEDFSIVIVGTSETKVEDVQYLPFGESRADAGHISVSHKYTSQELDAETGFYYYGARYYDPRLARFISPDTMVPSPFSPQLLNRYSYAANNPLTYVDPTGHYIVPMIVSAVVSAAVTASQGGDGDEIVVSAAIGAASSGVGSGVASATGSSVFGGMVGGATGGGANAAVNGGDVGEGMLVGGVSGGLSGGIGAVTNFDNPYAQAAVQILTGGSIGGIAAHSTGGDFSEGFAYGMGSSIASIGLHALLSTPAASTSEVAATDSMQVALAERLQDIAIWSVQQNAPYDVVSGFAIYVRPHFMLRYPGVNRLAPSQRYVPRTNPRLTPSRPPKPEWGPPIKKIEIFKPLPWWMQLWKSLGPDDPFPYIDPGITPAINPYDPLFASLEVSSDEYVNKSL